MIQNNDFIVIIPARGDSKRVLNKNIRLLNKKPLIHYTIEYALKSFSKDNIWVNSDSDEILNIGSNFGIKTYKRKTNLALDKSPTIEVILDHIKNININYNYIIILQPTSPLRPKGLLEDVMNMIKSSKIDSLFSVSSLNKKLGQITNNKYSPINYSFGQRSQDMKDLYFENGLIYVTKRENILSKTIIDENSHPFIVDSIESTIDIDTEEDLKLAEMYIKLWK